jgi:hypothetical protein
MVRFLPVASLAASTFWISRLRAALKGTAGQITVPICFRRQVSIGIVTSTG